MYVVSMGLYYYIRVDIGASSSLFQSYYIFFAFLAPILFLFLIKQRKKLVQSKKLPPGPSKLPLIGNLHQLRGLPHRSLQHLSDEHGPLMFLQLGSIPTLVISSADIARDIFKTHDLVFSGRPVLYATKKISYNLSTVSFAPYGEYWREVRKIVILELFSAKRVQSFQAVRDEEVALMLDSIVASSGPVNLSELTLSLTSNIVCRVAFGKKYDCGENKSKKSRLHETLRETQELLGGFYIADFFPWMGWLYKFNGFETRLEKNFRELDESYEEVIAEHLDPRRPEPEREDLVDVLLRVQKDSNQAIALGSDHIKGVLSDLLGGLCIADFFPWMGCWLSKFNGLETRLEKNFRELDEIYDKVIEEHLDLRRPEPEHEDLVDVLLRVQKDSNQAIALSSDHIKGVLTDMFIAGTDTSSTILVWIMAELIRNPSVMQKAQTEVREAVKGKAKVEENHLSKLVYLKSIVKEGLRLHPPAPLLVPRETTDGCTIEGYHIPAKTRVFVNAKSIGTDPKYWKNQNEFQPERFLDSSVDFRGQHFELLPFGAGRRGCPGMNFAILIIELALSNLLHRFDWELPHGIRRQDLDMEEAIGLSMHKKVPLCLVANPVAL